MKKLIAVALLCSTILTSAFCQVNSKDGYFKLKWGTSVEEAKKSGYKLTPFSEEENKSYEKLFIEKVDLYKVTSKDKKSVSTEFAYYMGKFFWASEMLQAEDGTQKKLESRYGKFEQNGILAVGGNYVDVVADTNGKVQSMSIMIMPQKNGSVVTTLFDWEIYKNISVSGRKITGADSSIVDELSSLASKLLQDGKNGKKPSYAFIALNSDNNNKLAENYVTDALTEATFNTGKIKIIERANLEKILTEQKFQSSGLVNEETAKSIGYIAGVDYVCYGTMKDTGDELTISARVVDVESGEICAMSRDTIQKDDYLKKIKAIKASQTLKDENVEVVKNDVAVEKKDTSNSMKSLWQVRTNRNDFDEYTTYTFTLKGTEEKYLFFGYDKYDEPARSLVRAGVNGNDGWYCGKFDFKTEDGNIITKDFSYAIWSYNTGWKDGKDDFHFTYTKGASARFFLDLFSNNNILIVRQGSQTQRFQTAGFWDTVASQGITHEEIENALKNEEF